jgi:hypothetical protein
MDLNNEKADKDNFSSLLPVSGAKAANSRDYAASSSNDNDYGVPKRTAKKTKCKDKDAGGTSDGELFIVIVDEVDFVYGLFTFPSQS